MKYKSNRSPRRLAVIRDEHGRSVRALREVLTHPITTAVRRALLSAHAGSANTALRSTGHATQCFMQTDVAGTAVDGRAPIDCAVFPGKSRTAPADELVARVAADALPVVATWLGGARAPLRCARVRVHARAVGDRTGCAIRSRAAGICSSRCGVKASASSRRRIRNSRWGARIRSRSNGRIATHARGSRTRTALISFKSHLWQCTPRPKQEHECAPTSGAALPFVLRHSHDSPSNKQARTAR
jgi:hypothetical protein